MLIVFSFLLITFVLHGQSMTTGEARRSLHDLTVLLDAAASEPYVANDSIPSPPLFIPEKESYFRRNTVRSSLSSAASEQRLGQVRKSLQLGGPQAAAGIRTNLEGFLDCRAHP